MSENQNPEQPEYGAKPTPPPFKAQAAPEQQYGGLYVQALPNSTPTLVIGILSILSCCCYGLPGLILGIIGLVLGNKDRKLYAENPGFYTESSYKNSKAGRICSIIAIVLSALFVMFVIAVISTVGWETLQDEQRLREYLESMQNR